MARLNEPAPSLESVESLKRRFIRQNRDIARANSTQSLRIRGLENETSRLLAENLQLREHIIQLQNELENNRAQQIVQNTRATKSQLEEKLLELGALISNLGDEPVRQKAPQGTKVVREGLSRSPAQKDWRNMYTMGEVVRGLEGSLPPIMENKSYPRKTLELHELEALIADDTADITDSPEIGPPPISQFVDEDPVKVDLPTRTRKTENDELLGLDPVLSVNLEQRKKRKDSIGGQESRRISQVGPDHEKESTHSLKIGAKRKMSVRDDDEREVPTKAAHSSPDEFKYTRVLNGDKSRNMTAVHPEKSSNREAREMATAKGAIRDKQSSSTASAAHPEKSSSREMRDMVTAKEAIRDKQPGSTAPAARTVLAAKSVNNSPRKSSKLVTSDLVKSLKADVPNTKPVGRPRGRPRNDSKIEPTSTKPVPEAAIKTSKVQAAPEVPAEPDAFSPPSQPSGREESRETLPPSELAPREEEARPSRRSRPSVSYAEPNLRAKMRRPTSEFTDAVAAGSQPDTAIKVEDQSASKPALIKTESESDRQRKPKPVDYSSAVENSPLKGKSSTADSLPNSITTHRKRRESILTQSDTEFRGQGSAIAALLAEKRRAKADAREKEQQGKEGKGKAENPDIYEFRCSSPETHERSSGKSKEAKPVPRSRRHTATGRDMAYVDDSDASDTEAWRARRQSSVSMRSSTASAESEKEGVDGDKALRKSISTASMADTAATRADRVAARRRSMML